MNTSYAPLGPIVSIAPTGQRSGTLVLAGAIVGVLLLGFLALAAALVLRGAPSDSPATEVSSSIAGALDAPAPLAAVGAAAIDSPPPAAPVEPAAPVAALAATEGAGDPEAAQDDPAPAPRRHARRARRARVRHAARARRTRTAHTAVARTRTASNEPSRLVPRASRGSGFGSSADVMRSLGL